MPRYVLNSPPFPVKWRNWATAPWVDTAWNLDGTRMPSRSLTNVLRGWINPDTWRGPKTAIHMKTPPRARVTTAAVARPRSAWGT